FVFDANESAPGRPAFRYSPQQALAAALSQYAPGKEVWISNQRYISGAIYSPYREERREAWVKRRLYSECSNCGYAVTTSLTDGDRGQLQTCGACGASETLGPARYWIRPPGFAHPVDIEPGTSADESPAHSFPTRAKLEAPSPAKNDP